MLLNASLKYNYKLHACITIVEQLPSFRGRNSFKKYSLLKMAYKFDGLLIILNKATYIIAASLVNRQLLILVLL